MLGHDTPHPAEDEVARDRGQEEEDEDDDVEHKHDRAEIPEPDGWIGIVVQKDGGDATPHVDGEEGRRGVERRRAHPF